MVEMVGWANFFLFAAIAALPGLFLIYLLRDEISEMAKGNRTEPTRALSIILERHPRKETPVYPSGRSTIIPGFPDR